MPGPGVILGSRVGPFDGRLDADLLREYAAATTDPSSRVQAGTAVPLVAIATQIWIAQQEGRTAAVSEEIKQTAKGGVHGEHDIVLHRPILPGEDLRIWVEGHGARTAGRNSLVTLKFSAFDASAALVAEQWWTTVYLGTMCETTGEPVPDHSLPDGALERPIDSYDIDIDPDMARRYAEVSGDWSAHHFDIDAARRTGFDRLFLHGLCTMALCAQGAVQQFADGDPDRVRRIAVRFASPTPIGERLHVQFYDAGPRVYAFEAECTGATVISHGRVELR
jgi:acyl dehydratase